MMKKVAAYVITVLFIFSLAACSAHSGSQSSAGSSTVSKSSAVGTKMTQKQNPPSGKSGGTHGKSVTPATNRMVIYNGHMSITVHHFQTAHKNIESLITHSNGYIVQSSFSKTANGEPTGTITARILQVKFQSFMNKVAKTATNVKSRSVNGRDVTKQYVNLNARLKAQQAVKQRLNSFLKKAKDSKDLLNISNQLAQVQEQIEQIKGQMQYLKNHSALATVTINISEAAIGLKNQKDLNTWDKTKNAFIGSLNLIVSSASALVVFFIGYSPILIILLIIAAIVYLIYRNKRKNG